MMMAMMMIKHARPTYELPLEQVVHKFKW